MNKTEPTVDATALPFAPLILWAQKRGYAIRWKDGNAYFVEPETEAES